MVEKCHNLQVLESQQRTKILIRGVGRGNECENNGVEKKRNKDFPILTRDFPAFFTVNGKIELQCFPPSRNGTKWKKRNTIQKCHKSCTEFNCISERYKKAALRYFRFFRGDYNHDEMTRKFNSGKIIGENAPCLRTIYVLNNSLFQCVY